MLQISKEVIVQQGSMLYIKLLTQDDAFKSYVNKAMLLSHFKYISNLKSFFRFRKVAIIYTCHVILKSS